jgi:HK97 family phage prohead protease
MPRQFVENKLRHRHLPVLTALGRSDHMAGTDLHRVLRYRNATAQELDITHPHTDCLTPAQLAEQKRPLAWVVCLFEHDPKILLGTTHAGTLQLSVDDRGLDYTCEPSESGRDVTELVERGDVSSSSFGFQVFDQDYGLTDDGIVLRTLLSVRLTDVSCVTHPAYSSATVGLRGLARHLDADYEDVERSAQHNELRKLFRRIDIPTPLTARQRQINLLGQKVVAVAAAAPTHRKAGADNDTVGGIEMSHL